MNSCTASNFSVLRLASRWASLPVLTALLTLLLALKALKRFLALFLRKHTPQGSKRASSALQSPLSAVPVHPSAYAGDPLDDYDPSQPGDPWSEYLDQPFVIDACRTHLSRCHDLDPASHDHP
jgi:hypothetical protein